MISMRLPDSLIAILKAHAQGRIVRGKYHPPGWRLRIVGDWLMYAGAMASLITTFGAYSLVYEGTTGYPRIYPGISQRLNLAILAGLPLPVTLIVFTTMLIESWKLRAVMTGVGLLGVGLTWQLTQQLLRWGLFGSVSPPNFALSGLSIGSILICTGGFISTLAIYFGEWAKQFDTSPPQE